MGKLLGLPMGCDVATRITLLPIRTQPNTAATLVGCRLQLLHGRSVFR